MQQQRSKQRNKPGRPAAGQSLTPQQVAEAAFQLIDADGIDAFSMRRLGEMLGVEAMALYNHFRDKDAILDAVASLTLSRVLAPRAKGSWRNRIRSLLRGIRKVALEHPHLFRPAITRRTPPAAALPLIEAALSAFADAGFTPEAQSIAYHTCFSYVRGFCLWETEQFILKSADPTGPVGVTAAAYPGTAAAASFLFSPDRDRLFEAGLDILLRGLAVPRKG